MDIKLDIKRGFPLKKVTTMALGGPAKYFLVAKSGADLANAVRWARRQRLPWYVIGEGSNLVVRDKGFRGLVIQNKIDKFLRRGNEVTLGSGNNLLKTILKLNRLGLAGMEKMAGIPGTVGGAIYGCAGAYGQEIKDCLVGVRFFDGKKFRNFSKKQCQFAYRRSIFKKNKNLTITQARFRFRVGERAKLQKISGEIIKLRWQKFKPGVKWPGSFFKNIKIADLPRNLQKKILTQVPEEKVKFGKVPVGYLLETVGAKGMKEGGIRVAKHHGNLIYNTGKGTVQEVRALANRLKKLVKKRFGITIEEEVQFL